MNRYWKIAFVILVILIPGVASAQSLRGITENPVILQYRSHQKTVFKTQSSGSSYLPFFEDFSTSSVVPDPTKWTDQHVYINNSFAIDPPSVTIATFDALDQYGRVYSVKGTPQSSDTLTSVPFDLSVYQNTSDTVRLSFFYQCGGRGEVPEFDDKLVLEFYHTADSTWDEVWFVNGGDTSSFIQVIMKVDPKYYLDGFRFRFRNYTSLSAQDVNGGQGALSNADCWNLDYIMMNTDRVYNHQTLNNDITITDIPRNVLDLYETVPWHHLNSAVAAGIARNNIIYGIRNYMLDGDSSNIGRSYYVRNYNSRTFEDYEPPWDEVLPNGKLVFRELPLYTRFNRDDNREEGTIEIASYLRTLDFGPKENDTSRVILHFGNSYVYDDGSPEFGFGIEGQSMYGALLAIRFRVFEPDTLTAMEIFFNRAYNNYNETMPFQLCVWKNNGSMPGELIYMSEDYYYPDFSSDEATFKEYKFTENIITTDSIIYVGLKQLTDEFLNIGYDVNNNSLSRAYVNTSGDWYRLSGSMRPGTVMIRAVFGTTGVQTGLDENPDQVQINVFPNPVSEILNISSEEDVRQVSIVDVSGRIVLQQSGQVRQIDVSSLEPGLYHLIFSTGNSRQVTRKIIVSR